MKITLQHERNHTGNHIMTQHKRSYGNVNCN